MLSKNYWKILCSLLRSTAFCWLQSGRLMMAPMLTIASVPTVKAKKGSTAAIARSSAALSRPAFTPTATRRRTRIWIPLTLKWTGGPLQAGAITYSKPSQEKYSFSPTPLSVVTGEFTLSTQFKVPASAPTGAAAQNGIVLRLSGMQRPHVFRAEDGAGHAVTRYRIT